MGKLKNNKTLWLLILIISVGLTLRLYNFSQLFYYTMDEEVMNLIQRRIVLGIHYPLIGSVSPLNTYLGPIFYYFGAAILYLSNLNPLGQSFFGILLGSINIFLIYFVTRKLFNNNTISLLAAVFYSTSFLQVIFDRRFWHLTPGPFLSLLILWSILEIKKGSIKFIYLLTATLIFGWNTDYTNIVLFLFVFIAWILFKLPVKRKEVAIAIFIFLLSNLPLVIFDLRHDFLNVRSFTSYFSDKLENKDRSVNAIAQRETLGMSRTEQAMLTGVLPILTFSRSIYTNSELNINNQQTYCKNYIIDRNFAQGKILPIFAFLVLVFFGFLYYKNRKSKESFSYQIVLAFYLIFQVGVLIYAFIFVGDVFEHYMATLLPYLFIILSVVVHRIYQSKFKLLALIFIVVFVIGNIKLVKDSFNPLGYQNVMDATKYALTMVDGREYSLDSLSTCFKYNGFYYPFILQGSHPVKSYQDPNYAWLYDYPVAEDHPERVVVFVSKSKYESQNFAEIYKRYQRWVINRKTFGGLEVLILDNSTGEFH